MMTWKHISRSTTLITASILFGICAGCSSGNTASSGADTKPGDSSGDITFEASDIIVFLGLSDNDNYLGTISNGNENLSLLGTPSDSYTFSKGAIYNKGINSVTFSQGNSSDQFNIITIEDYQFIYSENSDGITDITVIQPDNQQVSYELDSNNQPIDYIPDEPENPNTSGSCVVNGSIGSMETTFTNPISLSSCTANSPAEYCTDDYLNSVEDPELDLIYDIPAFYTNQSCSDLGYPYESDEDIWLAEEETFTGFNSTASVKSAYVPSIKENVSIQNNVNCDNLDTSNSNQLSSCISEKRIELQAQLPKIKEGVVAIAVVIELYYSDLLSNFKNAVYFLETSPEIIADSSIQFISGTDDYLPSILNELDDLSVELKNSIEQLVNSIDDINEDIDSGQLAESYSGLGHTVDLFDGDGKSLWDTEITTQPSEATLKTECTITISESSTSHITVLRCETLNIETWATVAARNESISSTDDTSLLDIHAITLNTYQYLYNGFVSLPVEEDTQLWKEMVNSYSKTRERAHRHTSWDTSSGVAVVIDEYNKSASLELVSGHEDTYPNQNSEMGMLSLSNVTEKCLFNPQDPVNHYDRYENFESISDTRPCPFDLDYESDMTTIINDLDKNDMWLLTGDYMEFLVED